MQEIYYRNIRSDKLELSDTVKKGSWIRIVSPNETELKELEVKYNLDSDLLKDGVDLYESPRVEHDRDNTYIYVRYCRPSGEFTSTHPLLIILMPEMIMTVSRVASEPVDDLIKSGKAITTQKLKLVLQILVEINLGYRRHLNRVTKNIIGTRARLQRTTISNKDILNFIDIEEDLNEFLAALQPYGIVLQSILNGKHLKLHEEDEELIEDLRLSTSELVELTKSRLKSIHNIREAYNTIATNNLNKVFKLLTSIAIFLAVPTLISGVYGMNVKLPFENDPNAFWYIFGATTSIVTVVVIIFRRKKWL